MRINWPSRAAKLLRKINVYKSMRDSCYRMGCISLGNNCQRHIDKWDDKLYKLLIIQLKGVSVAGQITDADIESARNKDITELLPVSKNGKVLCPFHDDHNPSGSIKNNRFKCWSCGASHDTIGVYMHQNNVSFVEAVKALR